MSVYSIKITESKEELISGVPRSISLTANIPSVIFYDFEKQASVDSNVYVSTIQTPTSTPLKINFFVSNGTDSFYTSVIYRNTSLVEQDNPAKVTQYSGNPYPFGDLNSQITPSQPVLSSSGGDPLYTPYLTTGYPTGFDGDGYPTGFTNKPYTIENYLIKGAYYNKNGQPIIGIGFVPPKSVIIQPKKPPATSSTSDLFFDPRAMVIYQDYSKEDPNLPPNIQKQNFSLPLSNYNDEIKDFKKYYRTAEESHNTGSFSRQIFNPRDNTLNYYYHDARSNRWIISKVPFVPGKLTYTNAYSRGTPYSIHRWIPNFSRRTNLA